MATRNLSDLTPVHGYDAALETGENPFASKFGDLSDAEWEGVLVRSITEPVIDGVEFPGFPNAELQSRIHGSSGKHSIVDAARFYEFCRDNTYLGPQNTELLRFLDYGCGWGRISRPFMRDFPIGRLFGFDPNLLFCSVARALNPYMTFLQSYYTPYDSLPPAWFDVCVSFSIFTHLPEEVARQWLAELNRAIRPSGWLVFTTYGPRWFDWLEASERQLDAGEDLHWYAEQCVRTAGSAKARRAEYDAGELVFFSASGDRYGEAAMPRAALERIIAEEELSFEVVKFDDDALTQDAYVLRRR